LLFYHFSLFRLPKICSLAAKRVVDGDAPKVEGAYVLKPDAALTESAPGGGKERSLSSSSAQIITCPNCQWQQNFMVWQSINVTSDPSLKDKLKSGELTTFRCQHCGQAAEVVFSLLYHDMEKRWMIWLVPDGKLPAETQDGLLNKKLPGYLLRLVRSRNELIEKLSIMDAGLDDRIVAAIKHMLRQRLEHDRGIELPLLFFDERVRAKEGPLELHFAWVGDTSVQGIAVSNEVYEGLKVQLNTALLGPLGHRDSWLLTDDHYAAKLLAHRKP
jgi:hypothetical protein